MSTNITAKAGSKIDYTYIETISSQRSVSDSDASSNAVTYAYGTGNQQANMVAKATGILTSGATTTLDFTALSVNPLGVSYNVNFTTIKSVLIANNSTTQGYNFTIAATGSAGMTDVFNGGTGNLSIKPYGSYLYTDSYAGFNTSGTNKEIQLTDGGSGVTYSVTVIGIV